VSATSRLLRASCSWPLRTARGYPRGDGLATARRRRRAPGPWDGGRFPPRVYPRSLPGWFLANGSFSVSFHVIGCQLECAQTLENRAVKAVLGFELGPSIPPASILGNPAGNVGNDDGSRVYVETDQTTRNRWGPSKTAFCWQFVGTPLVARRPFHVPPASNRTTPNAEPDFAPLAARLVTTRDHVTCPQFMYQPL